MLHRTNALALRALPATLFAVLIAATASFALAKEPGRGLTASFEIDYLKFIVDHHFSALRITELAAGTDPVRDPHISPAEGTAGSPGFAATAAKAQLADIKSLARRNNRMQREEILTALKFLREWYGVEYQPRIRPANQRRIELLTATSAGKQFDHLFLEVFSRHHYAASMRSQDCLVASELEHRELKRYCSGIINSQTNDIDEMRQLLCEQFGICDYQPLVGIKGQHSGPEGVSGADTAQSSRGDDE